MKSSKNHFNFLILEYLKLLLKTSISEVILILIVHNYYVSFLKSSPPMPILLNNA